MKQRGRIFTRLGIVRWLLLLASPLFAQEVDPYRTKPKGHEENRQMALQAHATNLKRFAHDPDKLVLPGLVADKKAKRVEVMVERTALGRGAPCEFMVVAETSDHAYEALLISFAKPGDVHRALQFIGTEPGKSCDPESHRYWARGEGFALSIALSNARPVRLEQLLVDRRTGKTVRDEGFLFTGARMIPVPGDPRNKVYAADDFQPKSIVSLFNARDSVLAVPYSARKEDVYQNTILNPDQELPEGAPLTLLIEPVNQDGSRRVKDLALLVDSARAPTNSPSTGDEALGYLSLQLKDGQTVLNESPGILSMVESMSRLDRKKHDYFLTVRIADQVPLVQAQALGKVLAIIDTEKGVRVEPPPAGQLHYRAFIPDRQLLDREARPYHPAELALSEKEDRVTGRLLLIDSVWKPGATVSELAGTERTISGPHELRRELDLDLERARKAEQRARPPVFLVFAPSSLTHGQLMRFLDGVLAGPATVHVYLNLPMPPLPKRSPPSTGPSEK